VGPDPAIGAAHTARATLRPLHRRRVADALAGRDPDLLSEALIATVEVYESGVAESAAEEIIDSMPEDILTFWRECWPFRLALGDRLRLSEDEHLAIEDLRADRSRQGH
jgi:hypothetical protein